MYELFYGFKEKPFQISPDPNFLYLSPNHNRALEYLEYGIERNIGIILLTGEVGSGKTTLIQYLRQQVDRKFEVAIISNTNLSADELLAYILIELNIQPDADSKALNLNLFRAYLKSLAVENRRIVLIIDEAQNLPKAALEEIRMLSNFQTDDRMPLQIFLIGQPEFRTILNSPGMHQLRQRIAVNYHLDALNREETAKYIVYRLKKAGSAKNPFSTEAVDIIYQATSGIPRSINILCDSALLYGFAEEVETVDGVVVKSVLTELNLQPFVQKNVPDGPPLPAETPSPPLPPASSIPAEPPKVSSPDDTIKKILFVLKKQLDKIDLKIDLKFDLLRNEVLKKVNGSMADERKRYEDLLVAHARIQAELERIKAAADAGGRKGAAPDDDNSDEEEMGGESKKPSQGSKFYKVTKVN